MCLIQSKSIYIKLCFTNVNPESKTSANFFFLSLISAKEKNGQKQVKKKAFKINAKIEDVGLNED